MGFYVPQTMRAARRWVVWDAKKIPYRADGKGKASSTDPRTWADFETAALMLENSEYRGAGFVIAPGDGLIFIDLDHCIAEDGEPTAFAKSILELFPDTYTEYSQSETGLHIVARGTIPRSFRKDGIEVYNAGRYMAFTGNAYTAAEPGEAQAAINELCSRFNITATTHTTTPATTHTTASRSDADILAMCRQSERNGADFAILWAGEWELKYSSQSEGDYRLLEILHYYSRDAEQVKQLFLESGLATRRKAMRADYIDRTLAAVEKNRGAGAGEPEDIKPRSHTAPTRSRRNLTDTPPQKKKYRRF